MYSSPHRFKYQTAPLTSQFPPGVSGVCTEPKKHLPFPLFCHILELGTSFWAVYVIIEFLVSTEAGILEVAGLPVLKNQHHLGKFSTVADLGWLTFENAFWPFWSLLRFFFFFLVNLEDVKNIKIMFSSEDTENSLSIAVLASVFYSLQTGKGQAVKID